MSPDPDESVVDMTSMTEIVESRLYRLPRLGALGHVVEGLTIAAVDIPTEAGVQGVLGYDFLKRFRMLFNPGRGVLVVQTAERLSLAHRIEIMRNL